MKCIEKFQCFPSLANADDLNLEGVTEPGKARDWQENDDSVDDISLQQLRENYNNGTLELMEFIKSLTTTLSKRLDILEKNSISQATTSKPLDLWHQFWSFNGKSIEQIAAGVPDDFAVIVEIVNYLDVKLTDYQLDLHYGLVYQTAPTTVPVKTREVVTFKRRPNESAPYGVIIFHEMHRRY
ncbi:unnamed protein product [Allacma fusca]|uniref:Uncharacterized protein n=1 Tax=Allacma fusca TaxID=39272 RepID=A0A8J2KIH7_9HEXA|nr:unnamed protein product [Allacma fusca]